MNWRGLNPRNLSASKVLRASAAAWPVYVPVIAYAAGHARHGELLAETAAKTAGWALFPTAKMAVGAALGNPLLGLALQFVPTAGIEKSIYRGVRALNHLEQNIRRLECGGDYQDTKTAANLRLRGVREMSGALQPARRFLGQEAAFFHGVER
jgi:hypothetical protein